VINRTFVMLFTQAQFFLEKPATVWIHEIFLLRVPIGERIDRDSRGTARLVR
jgi:hypothetical protein